jgi:hypothetical protein
MSADFSQLAKDLLEEIEAVKRELANHTPPTSFSCYRNGVSMEEELMIRYVWASADGNLNMQESIAIARGIRALHLDDPTRCIAQHACSRRINMHGIPLSSSTSSSDSD